jgi:hypothetical protein
MIESSFDLLGEATLHRTPIYVMPDELIRVLPDGVVAIGTQRIVFAEPAQGLQLGEAFTLAARALATSHAVARQDALEGEGRDGN